MSLSQLIDSNKAAAEQIARAVAEAHRQDAVDDFMKTGIEQIAEERKRQIEVEGWTPEHDAEHTSAALAVAGACYALDAAALGDNHEVWKTIYRDHVRRLWPFDEEWRKVSLDPIRNLVKAGALIAAEIDRIQHR